MPRVLSAIVLFSFLATSAMAQVIDFEAKPDGSTPVNNEPLDRTAAYVVDGVNVRLGFDTDGDGVADSNAIFERRGVDSQEGFVSTFGTGTFDTERVDSPRRLGTFFLRQRAGIGAWDGPLVITYDAPVDRLGGEIWDLDSFTISETERWRIVAYNQDGAVVALAESPSSLLQTDPDSLDSLAWEFNVEAVGQIRRVTIDFTGGKTTSGIGLAFNNFSPTTATALGIDEQPRNIVLDWPGGEARFSVVAEGAGPLAYQWRRDGMRLNDGTGVSGATTATLNIDADPQDVGVYDVVVSNEFGQVTSDGAVLAIRADPCPSDFDDDGELTIFDFLTFFNAFNAGCP